MSDEHEVTAGMDRMIGELLEHADRDRLPDTMLYFESHDGRPCGRQRRAHGGG